jgi:N-acetylglucosamine kinase-like BadF-type ATPase
MILIADGGSTKCDWILLDNTGEIVLKTRTLGLNPAVFKEKVLLERILENKDLENSKDKVKQLFFYGAGCGTETPRLILQEFFKSYFTNASVTVKEDTYAAVYATTTAPGIVCILGTGSNSSFFDGKTVENVVPSLGYILMDEASGNYFGKKLIRDYYYKKMPEDLRTKFSTDFDLDADVIKLNVYQKDNPNAYLASFAEFIFRNERNDYFNYVIQKGIKDFFKNKIRVFKNHKKVPVHFVGSIAYFSSDIIHKIAKKHGVTIGSIVRRPIDGLIEYHRNILK